MVSLQRQLSCSACGRSMANCEIDFTDWIRLDESQRQKMIYVYSHTEDKNLCFFRPMPVYNRWERNYFC